MIERLKRSVLRYYFSFFASRFFARILMPIRIKLKIFFSYSISFSQFGENQYFINLKKDSGFGESEINTYLQKKGYLLDGMLNPSFIYKKI